MNKAFTCLEHMGVSVLGWSNPLIDGELTLMETVVALKQMANHQVLMVQQQNLYLF